MIPIQIKTYLDKMQPGETLAIASAKNPELLTLAAKEYIDLTGDLEFSNDYSTLRKLRPMPVDNRISYIAEY